MAIAEIPQGPLALPGGGDGKLRPADALGVFTRPRAEYGWKAWLTGVDHKKVGVMYGAAALFFFAVGGLEALLVRAQLAVPNGKLISAEPFTRTTWATRLPLWSLPSATRLTSVWPKSRLTCRLSARGAHCAARWRA